MKEEDKKKYIMVAEVTSAVEKDPKFAFEMLFGALEGLKNFRAETDKRNANIHLVVMNLKPKYLEEMRELIIPEVFESLGIYK